MRTVKIDAGGGIRSNTQNLMDGFNIIVSIFLFSIPVLTLSILAENRNNLNRLVAIDLLAYSGFFVTSFKLLAIGRTIFSAVVCVLLIVSLINNKAYEQKPNSR